MHYYSLLNDWLLESVRDVSLSYQKCPLPKPLAQIAD